MVDILEKQYDLESRKYEQVNNKNEISTTMKTTKQTSKLDIVKWSCFGSSISSVTGEWSNTRVLFVMKSIMAIFFNEATAPTPEELDILHREAMRYFKETEVPPR